MKKILYISNIAGSKESGSFFGTALSAAKSLGMEFYVVANRSASTKEQIAKDEKEHGVHLLHADIRRFPLSFKNLKAYKQICNIIKKYDIDYIHCNTPIGGVLGRLAGKKCKVKKIIYQAHGFHFYDGAPKKNWIIYHKIERLLARFTDAIITMNSEDYKNAQCFKLKKNGRFFNVHGVGINLKQYEDLDSYRDSKRDELGFCPDDVLLISMGDLITRKNYKVAIEAIKKCNNSKLHYLICGKGPELDNLKNHAKLLNIDEQVHFLGFRSDIKELLAASDIFIFTSFQEGLPRSMMEAMASGLPCVASKIRGNVDLIQDGKGGYLCEAHDVEAFVNAILSCDIETRRKFKYDNLIAIKQYDICVVENELKRIYKEVFC